jgi:hypothetical protein
VSARALSERRMGSIDDVYTGIRRDEDVAVAATEGFHQHGRIAVESPPLLLAPDFCNVSARL